MIRMISTSAVARLLGCFFTIVLSRDDIMTHGVTAPPTIPIDVVLSLSVKTLAKQMHPHVAKTSGSYAFSPYGLSHAMTVLFMSAGGRTRRQIGKAIFYDNEVEEVVSAQEMIAPLRNSSLQMQMTTLIAIHSNVNVLPLYQQDVANFKANFDKLDLTATSARNAINRHVEAGTNGSIPMFLNSEDTIKPPSVLANAIAFKIHLDRFKDAILQTLPFHNTGGLVKSVTMITIDDLFGFQKFDFGWIIQLVYPEDYSIFIILPETPEMLSKVDNGIYQGFDNKVYSMGMKYLQVTIPLFKLDTFFNLNEAVKALGVINAFTKEGSGLSKITNDDGFFLGDVVQRAVVEFGDRNTHSIPFGKPENLKKREVFLIDRPFFFVIRTESHDLNLLSGRVEHID